MKAEPKRINALMDRKRVSSEFVFVIWICVIGICFVLRISDLNDCVRGLAPFQGAGLSSHQLKSKIQR